METTNVIKRLHVTEKANNHELQKVYTVIVDPRATKIDIKAAIEQRYGVKVAKVNIVKTKGKVRDLRTRTITKRRPEKKALIFLANDQKPIDFLKLKK